MSCGDNMETHALSDDLGKKENSPEKEGDRDVKKLCVRPGRKQETARSNHRAECLAACPSEQGNTDIEVPDGHTITQDYRETEC